MSTAALRAQFLQLVKIEPELQRLLDRVNYIRAGDKYLRPERFCANAVWYGYSDSEDSLRREVIRLAGFSARAPELRTMQAYDIAYQYLYSRLPNCRNCGCIGIEL